MQEIMDSKREEIRRKNRNEYKDEMIKQMRASWLKITKQHEQVEIPFDKEEVFQECLTDNDRGYERLGLKMLKIESENMLMAESFEKMLRYSSCKHYSWVVLIVVNCMIQVLDDYEPLIQAYLPIVDKLIHRQNPVYTLERGITALYLISRAKGSAERVIRMENFKSIMNEYIYNRDLPRMQHQSIGIIIHCMEKLADKPAELKILIDQGLLRVVSDLLVDFKELYSFVEGFKGIIKHDEFHQQIMANQSLLTGLLTRHLIGNADVKEIINQVWKQLVRNVNTGHIVKLINLGVLDNLLQGVKSYQENPTSTIVCLEAIDEILDRLSLCSMDQTEYQLNVKNLQACNFPQLLSEIQTHNSDLSDRCEKLLNKYFDPSQSMVIE